MEEINEELEKGIKEKAMRYWKLAREGESSSINKKNSQDINRKKFNSIEEY